MIFKLKNKRGNKFQLSGENSAGFTLFEIIIVVVILTIFSAISIASFSLIQKKSALNNATQEFAGVIKLAQSKTLASENDSQYGVYLNTSVSPNKYVLFKGASYASRDIAYDQNYFLTNTIEFFGINLGGGNEIVFNKLIGTSEQSGNISLRVTADTSQIKTVYISNSGTVGFNQPVLLSDSNRVKDSRHMHFNYSRSINANTENITLTVYNSNDTISQSLPIIISSYLNSCKLDWKGTIDGQTIEISTHGLTTSNASCTTPTQFSIHRDRRYNNKKVKVTISGDSGYLAQYSADGLTTTSSSIYINPSISNSNWQ